MFRIICVSLVTVCNWRFESSTTAERTRADEALKEDLMIKLIDRMLLGGTQQVLDMDPSALPLRELPHGNVASLYLMYLAYCKPAGQAPCGKSTFYLVAKSWWPCLRFRHASEHAMCVQCQTLKAAIRAATEHWSYPIYVVTFWICIIWYLLI
jgi:hypothetical protein